jgi:hypothetical protein
VHSIPSPDSNTCSSSSSVNDSIGSASTLSTPMSASASMSSAPLHCPPSPSCAIPHETVHPIIVSDLQIFEGMSLPGTSTAQASPVFNFDFDLSHAFPLPSQTSFHPDYQTLQEISGYYGPDWTSGGSAHGHGVQSSVSVAHQQAFTESHVMDTEPQPGMDIAGMAMAAPVLDATWQSFVEQLGF